MQKIIVILGPTATGKSSLGLELAKQFNGEVISADSRQIYKGLEIGTGMITEKEARGIPHHLLGIADPKNTYTVAEFKKEAEEVITKILRSGKLPILVGGTGFYIQAVVDNVVPPRVPPDDNLRAELELKKIPVLLEQLKKLDSDRAETVEPDNKRRIIRAIEIASALGSVPKFSGLTTKFESLQIGLELPDEELTKRIRKRVEQRLQNGWVEEVRKLLDDGVPKERLKEFGLGYSIILQNYGIDSELVEKITIAERQYSKRQMRWFKRDHRIRWFRSDQAKEIIERVASFLDKKGSLP